MYNKITLIGRLGRDVESKTSSGGTRYWRFSIATNEWIKSKDKEETTWHNITCFNEYIGKQLDEKGKAGTLLYIEGKQQYSTYTNKDNQEVTNGGVVLDKFNSVCHVMEKSPAKTTGNVKKDDSDFDDDINW